MKVVYKGKLEKYKNKVGTILGDVGSNMTLVDFGNSGSMFIENKNLQPYDEDVAIDSLKKEGAHDKTKDPINPSHYKQGIEVYDFIKSHDMNFAQGNAIKYISRYQLKNGVEDLKKAKWYLEKLIEETENEK